MDLELFGEINPNASSWSFGSVGTVRFTLAKSEPGEWKRLTRSTETVKNHRVWWEHQEKILAEDKARRKAEKEAQEKAAKAEREAKEEEERAEKERAEAKARAATRATQLEAILEAVSALDELVASANPTASLDLANTTLAASVVALEALGQGSNETARAHASQLITSIHALSSTEYPVRNSAPWLKWHTRQRGASVR